MIGIRRLNHDEEADILRLARGSRLGQAEEKDYQREVTKAEMALGLR